MPKFLKQFKTPKQLLKGLKMADGEREAMKARLLNFMAQNPVRADLSARHIQQRSLWNAIILNRYIRTMPIAILIAAVISGGVSFAAQGSLPGDALYSIKINVNEKIIKVLALSEEAKANIEARLAEERLEEAEELTVKGEFKDELREELEARFEKHASKVEERIKKFEQRENFKAAVDVTSRFEASLRAHEAILERLDADESLIAKIKIFTSTSTANRNRFEASIKVSGDIGLEVAANATYDIAKRFIEQAANYLVNASGALSAEIKAQAQAKLTAAAQAVARGEAKLEAKAFSEAFIDFQEAMRLAKEADVLMRTSMAIETKAKIKVFSNEDGTEVEVKIETENENRGDGNSNDLEVDADVDTSGGIKLKF